MDLSQFEKILKTEPAYRLRQAKQAVFVDSIENWETAITFPTELRKKLDEQCPLGIKAKIHLSGDGRTAKAIIDLRDGFRIESVLMRYEAPPFRQACSERGRTAQGGICRTGSALGKMAEEQCNHSTSASPKASARQASSG
ncbi:MAG: hypothetical protein HY813_01075 [Candidatus Portnoybacteria bacterium]|nr:hypothetical protein [Candidatus Portnoybacteria bacterium]